MKKLVITLLFCLALPIYAMDDNEEYDQTNSNDERTLTEEEFYSKISNAAQILKDLVREKADYSVLVALIQSHEKYKEFKPDIKTITEGFDISYFSKIEYDPQTKKFLSFSPEQRDCYISLTKMALERDAYKQTNDLLEATLKHIEAEEARLNESNCTIS